MNIREMMLGQLLAILFQWAHWKTPGVGWLVYWTNGEPAVPGKARVSHLGQHACDVIASLVFYMAWSLDLIKGFAEVMGLESTLARLPAFPTKEGASIVVGFALAFAVRVGYRFWNKRFNKEDDE